MTQDELLDHSPYQPAPLSPLETAKNLILIDNYDSFTWNVYQYLVLEGANVTVFRNDEVTLDQLVELDPTQLVISPGPGHPSTDSGISGAAIAHFSGRIPILGVCMGQQCMFSVFGGQVEGTGEILHGKTSPLRHDGKGVYAGLSQDLPVTRYHSLAGTHSTLPACLEVSSWIAAGPDGGKGIIMGVRHRQHTTEGVQFHPESILTAEGRVMIRNFLQIQGGTWAGLTRGQTGPVGTLTNGERTESILDKIFTRRREDVEAQKQTPSLRQEDLQKAYNLGIAPPLIDFAERIKFTDFSLSLMAEIKRASPSKGVISMSTCAPEQARSYAQAGASVISVLTEPYWFKGGIADLLQVRQAIAGMPNRPAVLRKDFIFDEYQILEARLAGADTVLLIVKMLDQETLERLYKYSQSLGMEPLVEVNNSEETKVAVALGAKVIGVNNRNLTNFEVDLETTTRLTSLVPETTTVCALSGISGNADIRPYLTGGVRAVLIGEALMRAKDPLIFATELLSDYNISIEKPSTNCRPLVKICGTKTVEGARAAIDAGADLIGIILVPGRKRCIDTKTAREISDLVHRESRVVASQSSNSPTSRPESFHHFNSRRIFGQRNRALLVGVFQNQPLDHVIEQCIDLKLDVVQLHGDEPVEWASLLPVPVIHAFSVDAPGVKAKGFHKLPLLDAGQGGSGERVDIMRVRTLLEQSPDLNVILAGGLTPANVKGVLNELGPSVQQISIVDVSSGVEEDGIQSASRISAFLAEVKSKL